MDVRIEALYIYPLKSAQGISVSELSIVSSGAKWDRQWMLIDEKEDFVSQRKETKLCLISQQITDQFLQLSAPNMETLNVPLKYSLSNTTAVTLFKKETPACFVGKIYDEWFSEYLGKKVRLVRSPQEASRWTSGNHGPIKEILFQDGYPFLLTTQETLAELNEKLQAQVEMTRFRPNIVVSGAKANDEESWSKFQINGIEFESVKACSRCSIITVDPKTSLTDNEVMRVLGSYRREDGKIVFGRNLTHNKSGRIRVGDTLQFS